MSAAETATRPRDLPDEPVAVEIAMRDAESAGHLVTYEAGATLQPGVAAAPEPATAAGAGGRWNWLFIGVVIVPVLVAGLYLFVVAADRYRSEARFVVRSTGHAGLALDGGIMGASLSRASEDAFIVDEYITSRDALDRLVAEKNVAQIFARPEADVFNRFPPPFLQGTRERLFTYFRSMVQTSVDEATGISTIRVTAFRPEDAVALTGALLSYAEDVVNRINDRANADRVAFARTILDKAKANLESAERGLTEQRLTSGMIDPAKEYQAALQNLTRLSTEASQREAALEQQVALTPNGPAIASQREKVKAIRDEIARQTRTLAGGPDSLAAKTAGFEQRMLDRDIASKELVNAEANFDASQKEAGEQRLYLQAVVAPNRPDVPDEPRRMLWFLVTIGACLLAYATLKQILHIAQEHAA